MNYLRALDNEILHNLHFDAICDMDTHVYHSNNYLFIFITRAHNLQGWGGGG